MDRKKAKAGLASSPCDFPGFEPTFSLFSGFLLGSLKDPNYETG